ncbi:hypothetical protein INT46_009097 [Mucor plumbeus]|uniref:Uncharacterized protein n=1 Tax=Mucor plumbeus TaxID=97098 RepID=A0A8H7R3N7_9FUNG|nr:hypothetical protein INT46_009097 [Mucor plumbeus]
MAPVVIAVDLTFLTGKYSISAIWRCSTNVSTTLDFINSMRMGDFYVYLTFIGIISVWSIYGLICALMGSLGGVTVYMIGLIVGIVASIVVGFIHIMLLFINYRPVLMNSCLQRDPSRLFWWSLGFEDTSEMKQIYGNCQNQWVTFATERIASYLLYSILSSICAFFIVRYQRRLTFEHNQAKGIITSNQTSGWSDDEEDSGTEKKNLRSQSITYHDASFPSSPNEKSKAVIATSETAESAPDDGTSSVLSADMYQQRQRLFDEIAKRKKARKSFKRKSITSNPSRSSVLVVHPLDLSQDPESYTPPPMPPAEPQKEEASWNRYNEDESAIREDEEALERQKRLNALSAERMEYEMYRSDEVSSTTSSSVYIHDEEDDDAETALVKTSHRKRPKSGRWSQVYADNNVHKPLTTLNQSKEEEEEDQEEDNENEQLMNPESQEAINK